MKIIYYLKRKIKKIDHKFVIPSGLIILFAAAIRFYNFQNQWILWTDQASFALLTRYALFNFKLPLLGQFTSAGPFQVGGEWYWFLMIGQALYPFSFLSQWVWLILLYILFVIVIMYFAKQLVDKKFALIVGVITAFSPAEIYQGFNLENLSPIPFLSLLAMVFSIRYIRKSNSLDLYLLALICGLAPAFHPQGFALLLLLATTLILKGKPKWVYLLCIPLLLLPWLPVFIADSQNHFHNTQNMINYYLFGQNKIPLDVLGRRWSTYLGVFIPQSWAYIVGGWPILAYLTMLGILLLTVYNALKLKLTKEWLVIILSFLMILTLFRYSHVPLFGTYLLTLHPYIILLTGYLIYFLINRYFLIGIISLIILTIGSFYKYSKGLVSENYNALQVSNLEKVLVDKYPHQSFAIYDYQDSAVGISEALSLYLYNDNKIDDKGKKIGITTRQTDNLYNIYTDKKGYTLEDLSESNDSKLNSKEWDLVNPSSIYHKVQEWFKN